jgi:hypothetical protein
MGIPVFFYRGYFIKSSFLYFCNDMIIIGINFLLINRVKKIVFIPLFNHKKKSVPGPGYKNRFDGAPPAEGGPFPVFAGVVLQWLKRSGYWSQIVYFADVSISQWTVAGIPAQMPGIYLIQG